MAAPKRKVATQSAKVTLEHVSTGERMERWPVDARGMIASGEYRRVDGAPVPEIPPATAPSDADPVPHVTEAEAIAGGKSPTGAPLVIGDAVPSDAGG